MKTGVVDNKSAAIMPSLLPRSLFPIRYVKITQPIDDRSAIVLPAMTGSPSLHAAPKRMGNTGGLAASQNPAVPNEKRYFPIPTYTAVSQGTPFDQNKRTSKMVIEDNNKISSLAAFSLGGIFQDRSEVFDAFIMDRPIQWNDALIHHD